MTAGVASNTSPPELRAFLARLLGWTNNRVVDLALRSVELATSRRVTLVLRGAEDLVPIAQSLHRRALGAELPFVVCDPRRGDVSASVRSPANYGSGVRAVAAAIGGTLCVRARRPPDDFPEVRSRLRDADDVMLIVCVETDDDDGPLLIRPAPIHVPPIATRHAGIPRIIDEYARDAIAELDASSEAFTGDDRAWVRAHAAGSLSEIEKATLRLVALHASRNASAAAARLGMAPVSLQRWIGRRCPPACGAT
jgi:hypothetical protein